MKNFKQTLLILIIFVLFAAKANCANVWINDLRTLFQSNNAIIYAINIRTFNAKDTDKDGIIEEEFGEERGNFLNAIDRLDELSSMGVNTIQLLPVTPVGKIKALGTAGSLYSASSFNELNSQLKSKNSKLSLNDEMRRFVDACHQRNIRVIVDLPCCGAYDLYLKKPELFKKDKNQNPIIPTDWTDVRLLDAGTEEEINPDVYNLYASFINMMVDINVDGIRATMAGMKPYSFWQKLIKETRLRNPEFLFLAEASPSTKSPSPDISFIPYEKLLDAGFDGYYGNYSELKNWQNSKDLIYNVKTDMGLAKKYSQTKGLLGNFTTHDQISPILINGPEYSRMIIWLSATLPMNSYFIDGFATGDDYIYFWANKKAPKSFTDDDYYFVHRGQMDIFNFSRKPLGKYSDLLNDFKLANKFKAAAKKTLTYGTFVPLKTSKPEVFAYARSFDNQSVIVIGNLDFKKTQADSTVHIPKMSNDLQSIPIKLSYIPKITHGKITTTLAPGEIQVLYFNSLDLK